MLRLSSPARAGSAAEGAGGGDAGLVAADATALVKSKTPIACGIVLMRVLSGWPTGGEPAALARKLIRKRRHPAGLESGAGGMHEPLEV
jgi:hypothetical protein